MWRPVVMQICPWCMKRTEAPTIDAFSRSTSSMTIIAELPPSSSALASVLRPVRQPLVRRRGPVKAMMRTSGLHERLAKRPPTGKNTKRPPERRLFEDLREHHAATDRGARSGFKITALPSDRAGATERIGGSRKVEGAMTRRCPGDATRELSRGISLRRISPVGCDRSPPLRSTPRRRVHLEAGLRPMPPDSRTISWHLIRGW